MVPSALSGDRSMTSTPAMAMTIAGSDSSGGAGIQADLKTFCAFGVYGASAITALTAQNTRGVSGVEPIRPQFVSDQIAAVLTDLAVNAAKTGMLGTKAIVDAVVDALEPWPDLPLIVDPVMVATSGDVLLADDAIDTIRKRLLPRAALITPNLPEAARLLETSEARTDAEVVSQARALQGFGARAVLIKGGHGVGAEAVDILVDGEKVTRHVLARIETPHTHGTGCTLSAAITALIALGVPLAEAVTRAKQYVWKALESGRHHRIGHGRGPADLLYAVRTAGLPV